MPNYLPSAPLLEHIDAAARRAGYEGRSQFVQTHLGGGTTALTKAETRGKVTEDYADRMAYALGLHPVLIWGDAWFVPWPEDDDEADRRAAQLYRKRTWERECQARRRARQQALQDASVTNLRTSVKHAVDRRHLARFGHEPRYSGGAGNRCILCDRNRKRLAAGLPLDVPKLKPGRKRKESAA